MISIAGGRATGGLLTTGTDTDFPKMPPDTISREEFAVLIDRAGLKLDEAQFEAMRRSYVHIRALTDILRVPRSRKTEGAHVFHAPMPPVGKQATSAGTSISKE